MLLNELTELQAVDFAFGAFLAGAFSGHADRGPEGWREFLKRPINRQIIRHEADTPSQFMQDFLNGMKGKVAVNEQTHINAPLFPVVHYFRKPGLVNTQDQKGARGRVWKENKSFSLKQRPVALDYNLVLLAWDKLALDKLCLAWYAYIYDHDAFYYPCVIGSETFDVRVSLMDNKNVALQNGSDTVDGKRLYAVTTPVSIMTNILFGAETAPPAASRVIFGGAREGELHYVVEKSVDGIAYEFGGSTAINPGTVQVMVGARIVAKDDGHGAIAGQFEQGNAEITVAGAVDYYSGRIVWSPNSPIDGVASVAFRPLPGRIETQA